MGCKEALFTLGDRPEDRYPVAARWLAERGYGSTLEYVRAMAIRVIEQTGLLPHLNPGVMSYEDLARLKHVSASMGLMLETSSPRLSERGGPHFDSPDKVPAVRLRTIEDAGRLAIPFTTGILVGIGETPSERAESLFAIREAHRRYRHVQEVIVQNFRAKPGTAMRSAPEPHEQEFLATIAVARIVLGPHVSVQAPPNLSDPDQRLRLLDAGINDWGGVSPLTPDHVNPERPWPGIEVAGRHPPPREASRCGNGSRSIRGTSPNPIRGSPAGCARRSRRSPPATGSVVEGQRPEPTPWQDPDVAWKPRTIELTFSKAAGAGLRADAEPVYGTFEVVDNPITQAWANDRAEPARIDADIRSALAKAAAHRPITDAEALALFRAEGPSLDALCVVADELRAEAVGPEVTYVVNRNINFTNVCYVGCRFCAFAQREVDEESYTLTLTDVADRAEEAWDRGATEVCMQGGIHPDLPGTFYLDLLRAVKDRVPGMHVHAFSPMEILNGATKLGVSFAEFLTEAKAAGLGHDPRHRGGDPGRRGAMDPHEGQAAGRYVGADRPHRTRSGHPQLQHDDVRPRRRAAALGRPHPPDRRGSNRTRAASRSSCRSRSCIGTRRSTWRGRRARGLRARTRCGCTRSPASCSTEISTTSRSRG